MKPWQSIAALTALIGSGVYLIASGVQTRGTNFAYQVCRPREVCVHPEWFAIGVALLVVAYFFWRQLKRP